MEKKIAALKAAYQARDVVKVRAAARNLVAYDRQHPFASILCDLQTSQIVTLAKRICETPCLPQL